MTPFTKSADALEHQTAAELRRNPPSESSASSRPQQVEAMELHSESNISPPRPPSSEASDMDSDSSRSATPPPARPPQDQEKASSTPFLDTAADEVASNRTSNRSPERPFLAAGRGSSSSDDSMPGTTCELHRHRTEPHPLHRTPHPHNVRQDYNPRRPCGGGSGGYDLDRAQNPWIAAKFKVDERQRRRREANAQRWQQQHHNHNNSIDGLPALPFHSHQELALAERCLKRLVCNSQFFPPRAGREDWFRRPSEEDAWGEYVNVKPASSSSLKVSCEHGLAQEEAATHVTALYEREVEVKEMLGRGGFCEVRLAYKHDEASGGSSAVDDQENALPEQRQCYAIKYLSPTIAKRKSKRAFSRGVADLAIEARFLSLLSHDHIIRLHYVSAGTLRENYNCLDTGEECGGCYGSDAGCDCPDSSQGMDLGLRHWGYFLLLDRLHETLDRRIKRTYVPEVERLTGDLPSRHHERHRCCTAEGVHPGPGGCHQNKRWLLTSLPQWLHPPAAFVASRDGAGPRPLKEHLAQRLRILRDVASAVRYLHEHHIIFRDIKPDNIGFHFDLCDDGEKPREVPKLFDFGLVKELKPSARVASISCHNTHGEDAVYKLTGRTGSRRYMCPEVAFSRPYNRKVDIYSFGVLLYEMSTLLQPFTGYTIHRHEVEVLRKGFRPCLAGYDDCWPRDLACLIEDCWSGDMRDRPDIDHVMRRLDGCIEELTAPPKQESSGHMTTARSILSSISQLSLSQRRGEVAPATVAKSEDQECSSPRLKVKKLFVSKVPSPPLVGLGTHKKTAPQA